MTEADGAIKEREEGEEDEEEECKRNVDLNFSSPLSSALPLNLVLLSPIPFPPCFPSLLQARRCSTFVFRKNFSNSHPRQEAVVSGKNMNSF